MNPIIDAMARALYSQECERARHAEAVLSAARGAHITDTMEPWEEVADQYRADALAAWEAGCEAISWKEIRAFKDELRRGQGIYEDAGGFFVRAIRALMGSSSSEHVVNYADAARALVDGLSHHSK